jgi:hypothetical protein
LDLPSESLSKASNAGAHGKFDDFHRIGMLVFRPRDIDAFQHQTAEDGEPPHTVVYLKSYVVAVPDPHRQLFNVLAGLLHPKELRPEMPAKP